GGMMGCRVVLLIEAGSPRLSLSDGHTSMESAPPGCSSLLVPCEDAGLLRGGRLLGTVNEVCFTSTLSWLTPTLVEAFRPPEERHFVPLLGSCLGDGLRPLVDSLSVPRHSLPMGDNPTPTSPTGYTLSGSSKRSRAFELLLREASNLLRQDGARKPVTTPPSSQGSQESCLTTQA
ncbi:hypothetical protein MTO96_043785, partial [Rhipicephalus appendiculatus]